MMKFGEGYTVLIVDDEIIIRERIKYNVEKAGFAVVGQAGNGFLALELYEKTKPDIIISDIFMPALNGTDLLEKIRTNDSRIKFIFLSGYSEFDYAISALKNSASDYLLKPLDSHRLFETLQKTVNDIENENDFDSIIRENTMLKDGSYIGHFFANSEIHPDMNKNLASSLMNPEGLRIMLIYGSVENYSFDASYQIENGINIVFFHKYCKGIQTLEDSDQYAALGPPCFSIKELRESFIHLRRVLLKRFYSPGKHIYEDKNYDEPDKGMVRSLNKQNRILLEKDQVRELLDMIEVNLTELKTPSNLEYYIYLTKGLLLGRSEKITASMFNDHSPIWILEQFSTLKELGQWLKTLVQKIFSEGTSRVELDLSTRVKQYLKENYSSSLSLDTIAVNVFAHPNYISTKFKEDQGLSVTEYLCSLRLQRASELLQTTNLSCKKISKMVGFHDPYYFAKCFKRKFGQPPSEFQNSEA